MTDMWSTDCMRCDSKRAEQQLQAGNIIAAVSSRMIVCPQCGDKRCPKAAWHENGCAHQ